MLIFYDTISVDYNEINCIHIIWKGYFNPTDPKRNLKLNLSVYHGYDQSTITEKIAAAHFPSNALRSKIFKKANGCFLKET